MNRTKIEWTQDKDGKEGFSWNPVVGCWGPGGSEEKPNWCPYCYAKRFAERGLGEYGSYEKGQRFRPRFFPERLREPIIRREPSRIFMGSMTDLFGDWIPDEWILKVIDAMCSAPWHTYFILTKNPKRLAEFQPKWILCHNQVHSERFPPEEFLGGRWPDHVWLGVSIENQEAADERIPLLLQTPATVRFVSVEPLLGPVDLKKYLICEFYAGEEMEWREGTVVPDGYTKPRAARIRPRIDWIICGGETGPGARPMYPDWVRSIRDQCQAAGVPFYFKQWGEWSPNPAYLDYDRIGVVAPDGWWAKGQPFGYGRDHPRAVSMYRVGKKIAGRLLDGRTWEEFPETRRVASI